MVHTNQFSPCRLEHMEERRLLSASGGVSLDMEDGTLNVRGTKGDDAIVVSLDAADATKLNVSLNGVSHSFNVSEVLHVTMNGKKGHDSMAMDEAAGMILIGAHMVGGDGNDVLTGASGDDRLMGGKGDDVLTGNAGADRLKGDKGEDVLNGMAGEDRLDGGKGADKLKGGKDKDTNEDSDDDEDDLLDEVEVEDDLLD